MKKKVMIFSLIMVFVLGAIVIVLMSEPVASGSLQIEKSYIDGSNDLVKEIYINADMGQ